MALIAACLMFPGVGKSGSPAPKSTTSTPSRRSRSASAATFIVEETLMVDMRSAISVVVCITLDLPSAKLPFRPKFGIYPIRDGLRHKRGNVASQHNNLFDHA